MEKHKIKRFAAYLRNIADSVPRMSMFQDGSGDAYTDEFGLHRRDVSNGVIAQQLTRATIRELFRFEYPERKWVNSGLVQVSTSLNEGVSSYHYQEVGRVGQAAIVADGATDLPAVSVEGRNTIREVRTIAASFDYTTQDLRAARLQGVTDIAQEKAMSAREAIDELLDNLIRTGSAADGLYGITNHPGIIHTAAGTGGWAAATAANIVTDFTNAVSLMFNGSSGVQMPDTVVFAPATWLRLTTLQHSTASDISVLQYLQRAFPQISRWDWEHGLDAIGPSGEPVAMIYRRSPSVLRVQVPMPMRPLPPQQVGLGFRVPIETRFGGVMMPKPRAVMRLHNL